MFKGNIKENKAVTSNTEVKEKKTYIIRSLLKRHVIEYILFYMGISWGVLEFTDMIIKNYNLSGNIIHILLQFVIYIFPSIVLLAYLHGGSEHRKVTRFERLFYSINFIVAFMLPFIFYPTPKSHINSLVMFRFDNETCDPELDWLQYAIDPILSFSLSQDMHISPISASKHVEIIDSLRYPDQLRIENQYKNKIAKKYHADYYMEGSFAKSKECYDLMVSLYDTSGFIAQAHSCNEDIFLAIDEISEEIHKFLGIESFMKKNVALNSVKKSVTSSNRAIEMLGKAIHAQDVMNDNDLSVFYLDSAITYDSTFALGQIMNFERFVRQGSKMSSSEAYGHIMSRRDDLPISIRTYLDIIHSYYVKDDTLGALTNARNMVDKNPGIATLREMLAFVYIWQQDFDEAIKELEIAYKIQPGNKNLKILIGLLHYCKNDHRKANKLFDEYIKFDQDNEIPYLAKAMTYYNIHQYDKVSENLAEVIRLKPSNVSYITFQFFNEYKKGNYDYAIKLAQDAIGLCKTTEEKVSIMGFLEYLYIVKGQIEEALDLMQQRMAIKKEYKIPEVRIKMRVQTVFSDFIEPFTMKVPIMEILPREMEGLAWMVENNKIDNPDYFINLIPESESGFNGTRSIAKVFYYIYIGNADSADYIMSDYNVSHSSTAFQFPPLGYIYEYKMDYHTAFQYYSDYYYILSNEKFSDNPFIVTQYGNMCRCYREMGQLVESEKHLHSVLEYYPNNPDLNYEMALTKEKLGKKSQARRHYQLALKVWKDASVDFERANIVRENLRKMD